jgi:hypothetical protein
MRLTIQGVSKPLQVRKTLWGSFEHLFFSWRRGQDAQNPEGELCAPCILVAEFLRKSVQTATTSHQAKELVVQNPEGDIAQSITC